MVALPDTLYWAMNYVDLAEKSHNGKVMARLDRRMSPFDPKAWSVSNVVHAPEVPRALTRNTFPAADGGSPPLRWLEPNTVAVGDNIRVFTRCIIDRQVSAHIAGVLDYDPQRHQLDFIQFTSWPGGQGKFFVIEDKSQATYWMLSNLVTNSQDLLGWGERMRETGYHGSPGNERR